MKKISFKFLSRIVLIAGFFLSPLFGHAQNTLYATPDGSNYHRIPAIAMAHDSSIIAISDYRYGNNSDLGGGHRIDLLVRRSTDNGTTWSSSQNLTTTYTYNKGIGYGDAAVVADSESGKMLIVCAWGANGYGASSVNKIKVAKLLSTDNGQTWSAPTDITDQIYGLNPGSAGWSSLFVASGRICQSRVVKAGSSYRLYMALLAKKTSSMTLYGNAVLYSDDFGYTWNVLGNVSTSCVPLGDEAKIEELADGTILISSRTTGGRYFNKFTFSNLATAQGTWGTATKITFAGNNTTNGEILRVRAYKNGSPAELLLQTLPIGSDRRNLCVYYKDITGQTASTYAYGGWTQGLLIDNGLSAYSTMCLQADSKIAMLWESTNSQYDIKYQAYTLAELTGNAAYSMQLPAPTLFKIGNYEAVCTDSELQIEILSTADLNTIVTQTVVCNLPADVRYHLSSFSGDSTEKTATLTLQYDNYCRKYNVRIYKNRVPAPTDNQYIWTGNVSDAWNTVANWQVYDNGSLVTATQLPTNVNDVIIPAGLSRYPVASNTSVCRYIYFESGARIGQQNLLTYTQAFVDMVIPSNRYVRLSPPLKNTYSGDFFTRQQGGSWTNFTYSSFHGVEGTVGPNRVFPGATYNRLYSSVTSHVQVGGQTEANWFVSGWSEPFNGLATDVPAASAIDVWVDTPDSQDTVHFHFPAGDSRYYYYEKTTGKCVNLNGDTIVTDAALRTSEQGLFSYDSENDYGIKDYTFRRIGGNASPMFAVGNPGMAYLDVSEFLRVNAVLGNNLAPFVYRHNHAYGTEGTETVLYYNNATTKLYKVTSTVTEGGIPPHGGSDITEVASSHADAYIPVGRGFRVMNGMAKVDCIEPALIGSYSSFSSTYTQFPMTAKHYIWYSYSTGWYLQETNTTSNAPVSYNLSIAVDKTNPAKVRILNFAGQGDVMGTINTNQKTITIANASPITHVGTASWVNGGKILYIYGCKDATFTVASDMKQYYYGFNNNYYHRYESQYIDPSCLGADIILDYEISNDGMVSSLSLRKPFVIYTADMVADMNSASIPYKSWDKFDVITRYAYTGITASQNLEWAVESFILPECEGTYSTTVDEINGGVVSDGQTLSVTIERVNGRYNYVKITGLYPNGTLCIMGEITQSGGTYTLTIAGGQAVYGNDTNPGENYYFYKIGRNGSVEMTWDATNKKWNGTSKAQISRQNANPNASYGSVGYGYYLSYGTNFYLTRTGNLSSHSGGIVTGNDSIMNVRFTSAMFKPNPSITSGSSGVRRKVPAEDVSPIVYLTVQSGSLSAGTMLVQDPNADDAFLFTEDAPIFDVPENAMTVGTLAGTQLVAVNVFASSELIPLYIGGVTGEVTLTVQHVEALNYAAEIYDALTGVSYPLTAGTCSVLLSLQKEESVGRWFLRKRIPDISTGEKDNVELENVKISAYSPQRNTLVVTAENLNRQAILCIYSASGRLIAQSRFEENIMKFDDLHAGLYLIAITADKTHVIKTFVR